MIKKDPVRIVLMNEMSCRRLTNYGDLEDLKKTAELWTVKDFP